ASTLSTPFAGIFSSTADPVSTTGAVTIQSVLDPAHSGAQTIDGQKSPITIAFTSPSGGNDTGRLGSLGWIASGAARSCTATGGESGDGWAGPVQTSGSKSVVAFDGGDVTYTLTCTDGQRTGTANTTLHWSLSLPTVSLYNYGGAEYGAPFTLEWTATV